MLLCEVNYGDFIIWREDELVILRIEVFLKETMLLNSSSTVFFLSWSVSGTLVFH